MMKFLILMKKRYSILAIMLLFLSLFLMPTVDAFAKTKEVNQHIYDNAGLLSTNQLSDLETMCTEYSKKDRVNIIILTHNDSSAVEAETYIENFYDNSISDGSSVILLLDMYNREVFIEGYGYAERSVDGNRINKIVQEITPDLSDGNYSDALKQYIKLSDKYIKTGPIYLNLWLHLAIALIIGAIIVGVMAYNAGGRMTVGGGTYIDPNHSGLIGRRDDYIRTHITRVRKPQNNAVGGGGGGISAGGHSHSSGGGKF